MHIKIHNFKEIHELCKPDEADFQDQMRYIGFLIAALNKTHAVACNTIFVPSNKVTFF